MIRRGTRRTAVGIPKEEAKLQRSLVAALAREPLERGIRRVICSEVDVRHGIADVVVATADGRNRGPKWLELINLKLLSFTTAKLLAQLSYRAYTPVADIGRLMGYSSRTVSAHLRTLESMGVVRTKGSRARLLHSTKSPFLKVTAFEVKTSDWKHGLYQATHYRTFAHRVAVALPNAKARAVSVHKDRFRLFGIGLAGIQSPASLKWYVKPASRTPTSRSRMLLGFVEILKRRESRVLRVRETL